MNRILAFFFIFCFYNLKAQKPVLVSDFTISYTVSEQSNAKDAHLKNAGKTLFVKGKMARADFNSDDYKQAIIYDNKTGSAVVLKELGAGKYMTKFTPDQWKKENKRYEGMEVVLTEEKQKIIGYDCKKALIRLKDGTSYSVYYTTSIIPSTTENVFQFKDIPGLVLEFETSAEGKESKITYIATNINLSPVPASRFELPSNGYRMLNPQKK